jgi:glycerol uptake facilitator-like aquaporin
LIAAVDIRRKVAAEALGTALLLTTIVGSGIMAGKLAGGNIALALLGNTVPTGAMLVVLNWFTASTSFANPAVTVARALSDELPRPEFQLSSRPNWWGWAQP